jgi:hypothetical protein
MPLSNPAPDDYQRTLERLDRFSYYTDNNIRIPFTRIRFGLSPLIGLVPVAGDFAGLILSLYVLYEARKVGASRKVQRKMIRNMLIEFVGGLLPVIGDAFDAVYKANTKNTAILRNYLYRQLGEEPKWRFPWFTFIWVSVLIFILFLLLLMMF